VIPLSQERPTTFVPEPEIGTKRYFLWTVGCQMNEAESAKAGAILRQAGFLPARREDDADIIIVNSCVVRQQAEDKVAGKVGALAKLKRANPELKIALTGCMVTGQEASLRERFPHVDLFYGPSEFHRLTELTPELGEVDVDLAELPHYYEDTESETGISAFVPIIYGCNFVCSYCIVPYRRGRETSRPFTDIVNEVEIMASRGVKEVTLLGQTVNAYGHDLPGDTELSDLLKAVNSIDGIERIRFLTSHPKYFSDRLIDTMAECEKICEHVNLPVQAGDNDVLRRMRRTYTVDHYMDRIQRIRDTIPGVTLSTDIIVGFPGETDEQFEGTMKLLKEVRFEKVHQAMYSPRPGTLSSRWEDEIPWKEKRRRHQAIENLQTEISAELNERYRGSVLEVLVDGKQRGRWRGRSRGNTLVFFDAPGDWIGKTAMVRVTEPMTWYLLGEVESTLDSENQNDTSGYAGV
jgi:tRNA-2-methylthio-N6-dimethylallyladenosine synthase